MKRRRQIWGALLLWLSALLPVGALPAGDHVRACCAASAGAARRTMACCPASAAQIAPSCCLPSVPVRALAPSPFTMFSADTLPGGAPPVFGVLAPVRLRLLALTSEAGRLPVRGRRRPRGPPAFC